MKVLSGNRSVMGLQLPNAFSTRNNLLEKAGTLSWIISIAPFCSILSTSSSGICKMGTPSAPESEVGDNQMAGGSQSGALWWSTVQLQLSPLLWICLRKLPNRSYVGGVFASKIHTANLLGGQMVTATWRGLSWSLRLWRSLSGPLPTGIRETRHIPAPLLLGEQASCSATS